MDGGVGWRATARRRQDLNNAVESVEKLRAHTGVPQIPCIVPFFGRVRRDAGRRRWPNHRPILRALGHVIVGLAGNPVSERYWLAARPLPAPGRLRRARKLIEPYP